MPGSAAVILARHTGRRCFDNNAVELVRSYSIIAAEGVKERMARVDSPFHP